VFVLKDLQNSVSMSTYETDCVFISDSACAERDQDFIQSIELINSCPLLLRIEVAFVKIDRLRQPPRQNV